MIEVARAVQAFSSANDVLISYSPWVVVDRAKGSELIACRIRRPREPSQKDAVLTVRLDQLRRYGDLCWIKEGGTLLHKGKYADAGLGRESRAWKVAQRLWHHLQNGHIPETVQIWPDEAFERERCRAFEEKHPDVWRALITAGGFKAFNEGKLALVKRFGWLTDKELASIRHRGRKFV